MITNSPHCTMIQGHGGPPPLLPHFMTNDSCFQAPLTGQDQYYQEQFYQGDWSQGFAEGDMYYHHDDSYYQQDHMYYQDKNFFGGNEQYYGGRESQQREQQEDKPDLRINRT